MGYKRKKPTYKLVFEDPEFGDPDGGDPLVVRTRMVSLGEYLDVQELLFAEMDRENLDKLFGAFAGILVEWNVEDDDDQPVPTTAAGLYSLDIQFAMKIITAWREAMEGVADPLPQASDDGSPSPEASIPMEPLSESRAS